jgi:hypothetical protein
VFLALCSTAIALLLAVRGAWLVAPFTGVEMLAVGLAFVIHARHAVDYERIRQFPNRLSIGQVCAERITQFEFNPLWRWSSPACHRVPRSRSCHADRRSPSSGFSPTTGARSLPTSCVGRCDGAGCEQGDSEGDSEGGEV